MFTVITSETFRTKYLIIQYSATLFILQCLNYASPLDLYHGFRDRIITSAKSDLLVRFSNALFLMSFYRNNIISNRSFRWWVAWFNQNLTKIIIGSKRWFSYEIPFLGANLIPKKWMRL